MLIDVISIFPEYFDVLDLSLLGKARERGLVTTRVHDLRDFTHDAHRTVDDSPYGGGAGMVMRAEPWGAALDGILGTESILVVPSPAGTVFSQPLARKLATESHLVFACGRYEGIDERVITHYSHTHQVQVVSLGDYVLNGGEVATLAMIEAIARLIPGMVGNPVSLVEESHEQGLLEYPSYTRPPEWRGHEVPPVLLSGHHAEIAAWRREQQLERTRRVRPDLLTQRPDSD